MNLSQLSDLETLTLTIIGEARGEPIEGQVAVANVIRNRSNSWKKSIKAICLQPKQFSCWNEDDPNYFLLEEIAKGFLVSVSIPSEYRQCLYVANGIIEDEIFDNTQGSLYYLTTHLFVSDHRPQWAQNVILAKSIGKQTFFTIGIGHDKSFA